MTGITSPVPWESWEWRIMHTIMLRKEWNRMGAMGMEDKVGRRSGILHLCDGSPGKGGLRNWILLSGRPLSTV